MEIADRFANSLGSVYSLLYISTTGLQRDIILRLRVLVGFHISAWTQWCHLLSPSLLLPGAILLEHALRSAAKGLCRPKQDQASELGYGAGIF